MTSWIARLGGLAIALGAVGSAAADAPVADTLRPGGYVLFLRHFATDRARADSDTAHLENCATQRPLSAVGVKQAAAFGAALRALKIPVGAVTVSRYCRAIDSARLAGFMALETTRDLAVPEKLPEGESERRAAALRALLSSTPTAGTNRLIVSHHPNLVEAAGKQFDDVEEGEVVVFQPMPAAPGYRMVARVKPDGWSDRARVAK
jgi:phosphohistidine phosphatase SixA